jgi:DNA-binding response OmpR family regulator
VGQAPSDIPEPPDPNAGGKAALSADLHALTVFLPTDRPCERGEVLTVRLTARGGLELRAMARVLCCHPRSTERRRGVEVELMDVRPLERPLPLSLGSLQMPSPAPERRAVRVLVVDDDATLLRQTVAALRSEGYEVMEAGQGAEALSVALSERPGAILSDVTMPVMDGWQLLRMVRARPELEGIPVLFHTNLDSDSERLRGYTLGVDDYVDKPAQPQDLAERIERAVTRRRAASGDVGGKASLRGDLRHVALPTLLTLLELESRSGLLTLSGDAASAEVDLVDGRVQGVRVTPAAGGAGDMDRICHLLDWSRGEFELTPGDRPATGGPGLRVTEILLEHARRSDEQAH